MLMVTATGRKKHTRMGIPAKRIVKRGLSHLAARLGPQVRKSSTPQLLVLMYHRILPEDDLRASFEEPGMLVTPDNFRWHLQLLQNHFEIVKLSDWLERKASQLPLPHKACAVTFDDGWADNHEFALPILEEVSAPATIFLVSDLIGTSQQFWPERLTRLLVKLSADHESEWKSHPGFDWLKQVTSNCSINESISSRDELAIVIKAAKTMPDREIQQHLDEAENVLGIDKQKTVPSLLNWDQAREMIDTNLIEVGSHTCHHVRLNDSISAEVMDREIKTSRINIEEKTGKMVKTFCFPNGDYTPAALELVRNQYLGAVTTRHGWNSATSDSYLLSRIGIHDDVTYDETAFLARISGWL